MEIQERLDRLSAQMEFLVERQEKREETFDELSPLLREVMAVATGKLDDIEKRGWLKSIAALGEVAARVLDHYTADDVRALGEAIVSILDTVKALTQPEVLAIVGEAGEGLQHADEARPIGLFGMARASRNQDVKKGMAVLMELLRHVGRAAHAVAEKDGAKADRKTRLAATLGPRKKKALGIERTRVPRLPPHEPEKPKTNGHASTVIDGISFTADGHLADASQWTRALAENIATREGVALTAEHWRLVEAARNDFLQNKAAANIRKLTQISGLPTKEIYALFPKAPGRTIAKIAGTPKPVGCI